MPLFLFYAFCHDLPWLSSHTIVETNKLLCTLYYFKVDEPSGVSCTWPEALCRMPTRVQQCDAANAAVTADSSCDDNRSVKAGMRGKCCFEVISPEVNKRIKISAFKYLSTNEMRASTYTGDQQRSPNDSTLRPSWCCTSLFCLK